MARDTAVFYDIENLVAGYSKEYVDDLSLREIVRRIREKLPDSQIAVQRAYANWSSHALAALRKELSELGIEPVQVFGFNFDGKKNASDLELVIDAIDLAYSRPAILNYVIVSGDGGFASLAKKLHEYGKTVVGCARQEATSNVFRNVCDDFVFIPEVPLSKPVPPKPPSPPKSAPVAAPPAAAPVASGEPSRRFQTIARAAPPKPCGSQAELLEQSRLVFAELAVNADWKAELSGGVFLAVVKEMLRFTIPGLQEALTGYAKFRDAVQCMAAGTPICLAEKAKGDFRLFARVGLPQGAALQPDLPALRVDSVEGYRSLLAGSNPSTALPAAPSLLRIARALWAIRPRDCKLPELIAKVTAASSEPEGTVKQTLFAAADCFWRVPGPTSADQLFTLKDDVDTAGRVLEVLRGTCRGRLAQVLEPLGMTPDEAILAEIAPFAAEQAGV